jgi:hypothetical protein
VTQESFTVELIQAVNDWQRGGDHDQEVTLAPLVSEKQPLEVAPTSVAPKKKTPAPILIND